MNIAVLLIRKETLSCVEPSGKRQEHTFLTQHVPYLEVHSNHCFPHSFVWSCQFAFYLYFRNIIHLNKQLRWMSIIWAPLESRYHLNLPSWASESGQEAWSPKKLTPPLLQLLRVLLFENPARVGIGNLIIPFHKSTRSCLHIKLVAI